tara:strand:- start:215 stop:364 length:150 start_codon:yes stop_codon:yes gene_type:complete
MVTDVAYLADFSTRVGNKLALGLEVVSGCTDGMSRREIEPQQTITGSSH